MNFSRDKDSHRVLRIGRWANAIEITTILEDYIREQKGTHMDSISIGQNQMKENRIIFILTLLDATKSVDKRYVKEKIAIQAGKEKHRLSWEKLSGKDIVYKDKLYKIPEFHDGEKILSLTVKEIT